TITATAILLSTPVALALSRNISFVFLIAVCAVLVLPHVTSFIAKGANDRTNLRTRKFLPINRATIAWLFFTVFASSSLLWTPELQRGWEAWLQFNVAIAVAAVCLLVICTDQRKLPQMHWAFIVALVVASCLILWELNNGSPVRQALGGSTEPFRLNRAAVATAILAPLMFLTNNNLRHLALKLAVVGLVWFTAFSSDSESAKLAIVVISVTLLVAQVVKPSFLLNLCFAGLLLSHALAPVLAWAAHAYIPYALLDVVGYPSQTVWLYIWSAHAAQIPDAFFLGQGIQAASAATLTHPNVGNVTIPELGLTFHPLGFTHPHNFSIQIWYELGLIGVALSSAVIVLAWQKLRELSANDAKVLSALLAGAWVVMWVSHGAWQHWWWALLGIAGILFALLSNSNAVETANTDVTPATETEPMNH
ncbi:MAG: hypothetical protein AAF590_06545, partial [Pseudomonadota bacterium]